MLSENEVKVAQLMEQGYKGINAYRQVFGAHIKDNTAMCKASIIKKRYRVMQGGDKILDASKKAVEIKNMAKDEQNTSKTQATNEQNYEEKRKEITESINAITRMNIDISHSFDYACRKNIARALIEKTLVQFMASSKEGYTPDLLLRYTKRDDNGNIVDFAERRQIPLPKDILDMIIKFEQVYGSIEREDLKGVDMGRNIQITFTNDQRNNTIEQAK